MHPSSLASILVSIVLFAGIALALNSVIPKLLAVLPHAV